MKVKLLPNMISKILFAIICCSVVTTGAAYAETETESELQASTVEIEQHEYIVKRSGDVIVKIFGTIDPNVIYSSIILEQTNPNGESKSQNVKATKNGYFEFYFFHNWDSVRGNYELSVSLDSVEFGKTSYEIIQDPNYKNDEEVKEEYYLKQSGDYEEIPAETTDPLLTIPNKIPDWVKNVFGWYYMDRITEEEVISAIEYLVRNDIIKLD